MPSQWRFMVFTAFFIGSSLLWAAQKYHFFRKAFDFPYN